MPIIIGVILAIIIGIIIGFLSLTSLAVYAIGMASGIILTLSLIRKLGKKCPRSLVAAEFFRKLTKYKTTVCNIERTPHNITLTIYGDDDQANLKDILQKQMQFPSDRVKEAIRHVIEVALDKPIEDKLREALKYLDAGNSYKNFTKEA